MSKFRWRLLNSSTWTYEDRSLPYNLPVTASDGVIVEAIGNGATLDAVTGGTLSALGLTALTFPNGATAGTVIGTLTNRTANSTLSITPSDNRVAINGSGQLLVGVSAATAGTPFNITVRETFAGYTNSPRDTVFSITRLAATSTIFPLSTPILFEGDSNTDWGYMINGWAKRMLAKSQGRFYLPVGGDYATAGSTVATASANGYGSMQSRQNTVTTRITSMISKFGRCIVWFQIGTNGGNLSNDVTILANVVSAYKAAGATVYCNLCPEFYSDGYISGMNAKIVDGTIPVDGYVNVQPAIVQGAGRTHYDEQENNDVGALGAAFLASKTVTTSIFADSFAGFAVDNMTGTTTATGTGISGNISPGWAGNFIIGDGSAVYSVLTPDSNGRGGFRLSLTGGSNGAFFITSKTQSTSLTSGDVMDAGAGIEVVSVTDLATITNLSVSVGNGSWGSNFPNDVNAVVSAPRGAEVWRVYPVSQTGSSSSFNKNVVIGVAAGKTAVIEVRGFFHAIRETAVGAVPVNTVAPVLTAPTVGTTASCTNGTWSNSPTSYSKVFYMNSTLIASNYTFVTADIGKTIVCYVSATNATGTASAVMSNSTTVTGATATSVAWDTTVNGGSGTWLAYTNSNRTGSGTEVIDQVLYLRTSETKSSGLAYVEMQSNSGGGIANVSGTGLFDLSGGTMLFPNGVTFAGGYTQLEPYGPTDYVGIAVNLTTGKIWFRTLYAAGGAGNWNNNASADPASGVGGLDIADAGTAKALMGRIGGSSGSTTIITPANFKGTPPSGAALWTV